MINARSSEDRTNTQTWAGSCVHLVDTSSAVYSRVGTDELGLNSLKRENENSLKRENAHTTKGEDSFSQMRECSLK